jgi:hypothetical protein
VLEVVINTAQLFFGGRLDIKIQLDHNIHRLQGLVNADVRRNPTGAAGYLPNERRLISARPSQKFSQD